MNINELFCNLDYLKWQLCEVIETPEEVDNIKQEIKNIQIKILDELEWELDEAMWLPLCDCNCNCHSSLFRWIGHFCCSNKSEEEIKNLTLEIKSYQDEILYDEENK